MNDLPNKQPDDDLSQLFDGVVGLEKQPNDYTLLATVWSERKEKPVSGMKLGMPWLGEAPLELTTIDAMRKLAKDFLFYFDEKPRIMAHITRKIRKRGKPSTLEIVYSGRVPYQLLDEL
jgi:hypothetical protein